jgi:peptidyl-prolyl cis-trans isomerase A (cyclophilin A)
MQMPRLVAPFMLGLGLWACGPSAPHETSGTAPATQPKPAPQAETKPAPAGRLPIKELNNNNVVAELTQFGQEHPETVVVLHTNLGNIRLKLYQDTPLHRANFVRLAKVGYLDGSIFYRVVKDFVVQGSSSDVPRPRIGGYTIPAEMKPQHRHVRGALSMSRSYDYNPDKRSASSDFFILHKDALGLNGDHTVFGEVIGGMDVVDKMALVPTSQEWPLQDLVILRAEAVK